MLELKNENFDKEVLQSEIPVIVDFWADWCGPCKAFAPTYVEVSKEYEGKLKFAKLDITNAQELAQKYSVMGIPTLIVFSKGKEVDRWSGALPAEALKEKITAALGKV